MTKHIPNFITLLNLLAGTIAVILAVEGNLMLASIFVLIGVFFDFFDGLAARLLKVHSELGKQLDSFADMVTSGVVPGIILYKLLERTNPSWIANQISISDNMEWIGVKFGTVTLIGLLFTLAAAYRLANFNIDERQSDSFIGLPTPAATLVVISLPFILHYSSNDFAIELINNKWILIALTLVLSFLMNANLPLFGLKLKDLSWKNNAIVYIFLLVSLVLLIALKFVAVPLIIVLYVLFSVVGNMMKKE